MEKEVTKMERIKCCPKCGSTNINFLVFYRPSIWKCLDCGYEGAFIIEDGEFAEKMQARYQQRCNIIGWVAEERRIDSWGGSTDNWPKILEDHMELKP
jgi:DNA-directed RNA polymerase subunit M